MYETPTELEELQRLLDASLRGSTEHLRSIIQPDRSLSAAQLVTVLTGMHTLTVATVTASGEPRISAVDGHFLHGRWVFTTSASAAKARHLRARPAVSVAHVDGERIGVFTHGRFELVPAEHPDRSAIEDHLVEHYGSSPSGFADDIIYGRVRPHWMVTFASDPAAVTVPPPPAD